MRVLAGCSLAFVVGLATATAVQSVRAAPADAPVIGPVVGEATEFREKSRPNGNEIYKNLSTHKAVVTVIFEAGTDAAVLQLEEPSGKFTGTAKATARTVDRQKAVSVVTGPGSSLWLRSEGGTARWQLVSVVPGE